MSLDNEWNGFWQAWVSRSFVRSSANMLLGHHFSFNQFKQKWWIRPNRMDHYGNLTRTEEGRKFWTTPKITNWVKFLFTNGPIPVSFCLFLFFPHYNFNNANWKSKDGVLGIWTRGRRIVGTGKNSKNWTLYVSLNKIRQKIHLNANLWHSHRHR